MWQFELAKSAGNDETRYGLTSPTWLLHSRFTFAGGVTTTLSLPWSSFEHMVGNSLVMKYENDTELMDLVMMVRHQVSPLFLPKQLPPVTARELRSVLEGGRREVKRRRDAVAQLAAGESVGVEEFEEEGVDLTPALV